MIYHKLDRRHNFSSYFRKPIPIAELASHDSLNPSTNLYPKLSPQMNQTIPWGIYTSAYANPQKATSEYWISNYYCRKTPLGILMTSKVHDTCSKHILYYFNVPLRLIILLRMIGCTQIKSIT